MSITEKEEIYSLEERIRIVHAQLMKLTNKYKDLNIQYNQLTDQNTWLHKGIKLGDQRNSKLLQQIERLTTDNIKLAQKCTQETSLQRLLHERVKQMEVILLERKKQLDFAHKVIKEKDHLLSNSKSKGTCVSETCVSERD